MELDHRTIADGKAGPVSSQLQKLYFDSVVGNNPKFRHWCTPAAPRTEGTAIEDRLLQRGATPDIGA